MKEPNLPTSLDDPAARSAFLAGMCSPAAYAALHPVTAPVRLVETHVSWVFLTGPYAYKIKKPLRLSFLDYGSASRREAFCREELRLNRRHAPELYVDVVGIGGSPAQPRPGAPGPWFEHALRMRQFDPDLELARLLEAQAVTAPELAEFGAKMARMHESATIADAASGYGSPPVLHCVNLANFAEIAAALPPGIHSAQLDRLRAGIEQAFAMVSPLMEQRRQDGRVRECHGDLHCGNVVRWMDRLVAFDGLEFDPALRFIDVANDLAFLTMDLAVHGRDDLRGSVLNAWTSYGGDYQALELLPYYESYRALVRAKVAAVRELQRSGGAVEPRRAIGRTAAATGGSGPGTGAIMVQHYLEWARRRAIRGAPALVVMTGLSGSGKTWMARRIAAACYALHVRSDVERKRLAGLGPLVDSGSAPDAGLYTPEFGARTYARLVDCVSSCLRGDENVVIDAANLRRHERDAFRHAAAAAGAGARVAIVHCQAPIDVLRQRVAARRASGSDASEATVELLDRQPGYWEPLTDAEMSLALAVDTRDTATVEAALRAVRSVTRFE
ncbi:MAG: AAA family ATPase [Steroidobacteraceae bacterium]